MRQILANFAEKHEQNDVIFVDLEMKTTS